MCCVTRGREGGKGGRGGEGEGREEGGREGRDDCYTVTYTYYSDGTIYTDQQ